MTDGPLRVGLLWHSLRSDNLGCGALTVANVAILRSAAAAAGREVRFTIIGVNGRCHYPISDLAIEEVIFRSSRDLLPGSAAWKAIGRQDLVLDIGAGDSYADIYGWKRFMWLYVTKLHALLQRRPLILAPQTIGPFRSPVIRRLAADVMRRCRKVFARDGLSRGVLEQLGLSAVSDETMDVAFRLPFERADRSGDGRVRVGVNVSGLLYGEAEAGGNRFGFLSNYADFIHRLIEMLQGRPNTDVVLVPHVVGDDARDNDIDASHRVAARHPGVTVAPLFGSPSDAKSYISGLDLLIGSRMHATIAALSTETPVVPLAYSRKFSGIFDALGYPHYGDFTKQDADTLLALVSRSADHLDELRAVARTANAAAQQRLARYETYLVELLATSGGGRAA